MKFDPHSVALRAPPLPRSMGGEEALAARPGSLPLPHESGGEVAAKRTEWG